MTSRSREGRRRAVRAPGIWRGPLAASDTIDRPAVQHGARDRVFVAWRFFSGMLIICLLAVLFVFFNADAFYVNTIAVSGLRYLTTEEVFTLTEIAGMHIFWVDPEAVRQALQRSPMVADADIQVGWPPNMVQIVLDERQPALAWEQAGVVVWTDLQGRVMQQREERPDLLRIISEPMIEGPLAVNVRVDSEVVNGALQLRSLFPEITVLRYHPDKGLGYNDGRGWEVWFGSGTDMPEKILVYDAIVANLLSRNIQPGEVNISNLDAPYYSTVEGR